MVRLIVTLCVALAAIRLYANPLHLRLDDRNSIIWLCDWHGPANSALREPPLRRASSIFRESSWQLSDTPRITSPLDEWVYNAADIDNSKVVWAREMDDADNLDLIRYYKNRTVWLVAAGHPPGSKFLHIHRKGHNQAPHAVT